MRAAVMSTHPQLMPWIEEIRAYVPGKSKADDGRALVKLSANENPLGCSPAALAVLENPGNPADYPGNVFIATRRQGPV